MKTKQLQAVGHKQYKEAMKKEDMAKRKARKNARGRHWAMASS